ncbi:MAG: hypothetical protein GX605_06350 [Chloroflexi bacterium]|nr:hypothetical protein [Chloroflexota bacterium]
MSKGFDVLVVGRRLFCDVIFTGLPQTPALGHEVFAQELTLAAGGAISTAAALKRPGLEPGLVADLGSDPFSQFVLGEVRQAGLEASLLRLHGGPLPVLTVAFSNSDDRGFIFYAAASPFPPPGPGLLEKAPAPLLHFGNLRLARELLPLLRAARARGLLVTSDCQWPPASLEEPGIAETLGLLDAFMPNAEEARAMTGQADLLAALARLGALAPQVAVKDGCRGALGVEQGRWRRVGPLPVQAVDPIGAGDCFSAGYLLGLLEGRPLTERLHWGNICGGCCTRPARRRSRRAAASGVRVLTEAVPPAGGGGGGAMAAVKIAVIGGGSAYTASFLRSLVGKGAAFRCSQITLMDVAAEQAALIARLGQRMAEGVGLDLWVESVADRRTALRDAGAVLTTFRAGGLEALPLRHGVIGHETVGPGGFFFALRTLPLRREMAAEVAAVAPRAWWLNYSNPTNIVAEALTRRAGARAVGLCDRGRHDARQVLRLLGRPAEGFQFWSAGLNHANWCTRFRQGGQEIVPLLVEEAPLLLDDPTLPSRWRQVVALTAQYGLPPSSYLPYYAFPQETVAEGQRQPASRAEEVMAELPAIWAHYEEQAERSAPQLTRLRGSGGFDNLAVEALDALLNDTGAVHIVNTPGRGALPGFPAERVVELPCRLDADGATPLVQPPLPAAVAGLIEVLGEYQALAAEAGWCGGRREAIAALAANPLVWSLPKARALYDDLAAAHRTYLPQRLLRWRVRGRTA